MLGFPGTFLDSFTMPTDTSPQELRDRAAIQDLLATYFAAVDRRDFKLAERCFASGAVATYGDKGLSGGPRGVVAGIRGLQSQRSYNFLLNQAITVIGKTGRSDSYVNAHEVVLRAGKPLLKTQGVRYEDELIQEAGRWVIAKRTQVVDWEREDPVELPTAKRREA